MFLRKKLLKTYKIKRRKGIKNDIGEVLEGYDEERDIEIDIQPKSADLQAHESGERIKDERTGYTYDREVQEGDIICIEGESYKITGVKKWNTHTVIDMAKKR